jgi:predicted ATPase
VFRPICLAFLADAYAAGDQPGLAGRTFQEALEIAADTGERWAEPEIHRLFGDFLSRGKDSPPPAAIARYEEAVATARRQGSRSFELRATMSLARIVSPTGGPTPWHERLSAIYQTFTKELSTEELSTDLSEARALLAAGAVSRA